jgi:glycosyltransferase involved in cell wall biosynthesis
MTCAACPVGTPACRGLIHPADCRHAARGTPGYAELLRRAAGLPPPAEAPRRRGRPRVGFATPVMFAAGGTETWHRTLLPRLDPARVEYAGLAVLEPTLADPGALAELARLGPAEVGMDALRALAARCDVLVAWGMMHVSAWLPPRGTPGRPALAFVSHGDAPNRYTREAVADARWHADAFVAVAETALGPIPPEDRARAVVIENLVDPARVANPRPRAATRAAWGVPADAPVVGYLGRLSPEKDPQAVLRAAEALGPPWWAVLVGDGHDAVAVTAEAAARLPGRHALPGFTQDVASALAAVDVVVAASAEEGFGFSMIEAVLAGVPLVATRAGILASRPELADALVPIGAAGPDLAAAVRAALADTPGMRAGRAAARAAALRDFDPAKIAARWSSFLARLAGQDVAPVPRRCGCPGQAAAG